MLLRESLLLALLFCLSIADDDVQCPEIIKRSQWTSRKEKTVNYLILPLPYVVIHHSVTPECDSRESCTQRAESIQSTFMDTLGWDDIGYSFMVGGDGRIYEGSGWSHEGAHTYGYNKRSISIAFIGNFQDKPANDSMLDAAHKLITYGISCGVLREDVKVIAARQVSSTASPGKQLFLQIQKWPEWTADP